MIERLGILIVILGVAWLIDRGRAAFRSRPPAVTPRTAPPAEILPDQSVTHVTRKQIRPDWLRLERRSK